MCGEVLPLDTVFAYGDERMLATAELWSAFAEFSEDSDRS
jgi:hypothetical protein